MDQLTIEELKVRAKVEGWTFLRARGLPLGGYWRSPGGEKCYYVKQVAKPQKEKGK